MNQRQRRPAEERFWAKVDKRGPDECWPWLGKRGGYGHGAFYVGGGRVGGVEMGAHRYAWVVTEGPIPEGMNVLHRCDNPPCVNPRHLFLGTFKDNTQDMLAKGRDGHGVLPGVLNPAALLNEEQVREIRRRAAAGEPQPNIAAAYGVSRQTVSAIHTRAAWRCIPECV